MILPWRVLLGVAMLIGWMPIGGASHAQGIPAEPTLTHAEFDEAKQLFFQRCAGCHGVMRKGATGKNLEPENTRKIGQQRLERIIALGTEGGMNNFDDVFTKEQIRRLATYIQQPPPVPPEMSLAQMKASRKVLVAPDKYPTKPAHRRHWQNFFVTILRDAGKVAILDGDTKEVVTRINTGYAVHVVEETTDGRFWYSVGRDGKLTKIDLWMNPPQVVAEVRVAYDARGISVARHGPMQNKYLIAGAYWPPQFVIVDAVSMEPLKAVSTSGADIDGEFVREARVAALLATKNAPTWMVAVKELGQVWQVDYSDIKNLKVTMIDSARFLHDGFFDPSERYFQVAANSADRMAFIDSQTSTLAGMLDTGRKPHTGPGANWTDPQCGPVGATVHLGEGKLTVWGNDPQGHPQQAWKACYSLPTEGPGLFLRAHPNSPHVFLDQAQHPEPAVAQSIQALDIKSRRIVKKLRVTETDKAVATHIEFNHDGSEAWVSVWAKGGKADWAKGEVVIYDSTKLNEKARIKGLETPTGKFNVASRMNHRG